METILLFTSLIKPQHFRRAMDVPTRILWAFPIPQGSHAMVFSAFDLHGHGFLFRLSTRRNGRYHKPVLCRGFLRRFLQVKGIHVGDKVTWYMVMDRVNGVATYRVKAQRKIIALLGQDIWIDVEELRNYGAV